MNLIAVYSRHWQKDKEFVFTLFCKVSNGLPCVPTNIAELNFPNYTFLFVCLGQPSSHLYLVDFYWI